MKTSKLSISFSNVKSPESIPDKKFFLDSNDIIIYTIYLPDFTDLKSELSKFLSDKEIKKAKRYYKESDTNRFITYRAILKFILAAHSNLRIKDVYFDYNFNKKPYLISHPWLHFNVSHSEEYAAIAISRKKVGIDIEYMSNDFKFTTLLPDVFEDNEVLQIQNSSDIKHAFYTSWTRKEAFVKALGKGIDEDFKNLPSLDGQYHIDSTLLRNTQNWQVYSFDFAENYLGAVAFEDLPEISKNIILYTIPNNMEELLEMTPKRN
ncbi:4'-phosphopantetheinyl transferase family protein [Flavobacterium sp.]|uniref:4'-phosphopantetheinyl transferase family protein n=1 Tax=Flavobacterium sp. TaxID=239 RepID=UPI002ED92D95